MFMTKRNMIGAAMLGLVGLGLFAVLVLSFGLMGAIAVAAGCIFSVMFIVKGVDLLCE